MMINFLAALLGFAIGIGGAILAHALLPPYFAGMAMGVLAVWSFRRHCL